MQKWINIKDELPEIDVDVLLFFEKYGTMVVGSMLYDDGENWTCNTGGEWYTDCDCVPAFWMSLPKPPKEAERT